MRGNSAVMNSRLQRLLLALLLVTGLSAGALGLATAADDFVQSEPQIAAAGGEDDEGIHVSDETLATSIFIPFCFVGATLVIFIWAIRNRAKPEDDERPMPWWRTRQWYTRGTDADEG